MTVPPENTKKAKSKRLRAVVCYIPVNDRCLGNGDYPSIKNHSQIILIKTFLNFKKARKVEKNSGIYGIILPVRS